jgi:hypothetical protein
MMKVGTAIAARVAIIATTIISSIRVKPAVFVMVLFYFPWRAVVEEAWSCNMLPHLRNLIGIFSIELEPESRLPSQARFGRSCADRVQSSRRRVVIWCIVKTQMGGSVSLPYEGMFHALADALLPGPEALGGVVPGILALVVGCAHGLPSAAHSTYCSGAYDACGWDSCHPAAQRGTVLV